MKSTFDMTPQETILIGHDHGHRSWNGERMHYFGNGSDTSVRMDRTGFFDNHMQDIYEGDIVRENDMASVYMGQLGVVIWWWEQAKYVVRYGRNMIKFGDYYMVSSSRQTSLVVVGNIYEHPELVGGQ